MKAYDLVVLGEINPDLILSGQDVIPTFGQVEKLVSTATLTIGSSSVITACGAARLGLNVAFVGIVGDDLFGHFMLDAMRAAHIDCSHCIVERNLQTGFSVILAKRDGDRALLTFPGTIAALRLGHVNLELLRQARHLHVGSYFLLDGIREELPTLFELAQNRGLTTSIDTNWDPRQEWQVSHLLPHCDVLLPNQQELTQLSGTDDVKAGLAALSRVVETVAVKLGPAGGMVRRGADVYSAPALPVNPVDTTGAGDSFNAAFLYAYLNDYPLAAMIRLACAAGSLSTQATGGTTAQPTLDQLQAALDKANHRS